MLLERSFIAIEQGNSSFYFRNSSFLGVRGFLLRNFGIPCVIAREQSDRSNLSRNSRILVIASEAKQSLEILNLSL